MPDDFSRIHIIDPTIRSERCLSAQRQHEQGEGAAAPATAGNSGEQSPACGDQTKCSPERDPCEAHSADTGSDHKASPRTVSDVDTEIGRLIRKRRRERSMTLEDLARTLGLSYQQVHKYENGTNRISGGTLYKIAAIFACDLTELFPAQDWQGAATDPVTRLGAVRLELSDILTELGQTAPKATKVS